MAKNSPILLKSKAFAHKVTPANLSPFLGAFLLLKVVGKMVNRIIKNCKLRSNYGQNCGQK